MSRIARRYKERDSRVKYSCYNSHVVQLFLEFGSDMYIHMDAETLASSTACLDAGIPCWQQIAFSHDETIECAARKLAKSLRIRFECATVKGIVQMIRQKKINRICANLDGTSKWRNAKSSGARDMLETVMSAGFTEIVLIGNVSIRAEDSELNHEQMATDITGMAEQYNYDIQDLHMYDQYRQMQPYRLRLKCRVIVLD
jgi:hypothetical protein